MLCNLPQSLKPYVIEQDYAGYSFQDHALWRYCLNTLRARLAPHTLPAYLLGLEQTGLSPEHVAHVPRMNTFLKNLGWQAACVSGFIPPAAFMEFQALGILPIAADMRLVENVLYTPAPDIVHEAAGHAPMLSDKEFSAYLKHYAQVASKALVNKEDLTVYESIRLLSELEENPHTDPQELQKAKNALAHHIQEAKAQKSSEASLLGRMNWWTVEYGLVGDLKTPKIYGAGLLSSLGEGLSCLDNKVQKLPLDLNCLKYAYDITKPQPQLFVVPKLSQLKGLLDQFAATMAFSTGGAESLEKARASRTLNAVRLCSGLEVSGVVESFIHQGDEVHFIKWSGACQLAHQAQELPGHSRARHAEGYSTPLGPFVVNNLQLGEHCTLQWESGFVLEGMLAHAFPNLEQPLVLSFTQPTLCYKGDVFFKPEWGEFDLGIGTKVTSIKRGPADPKSYGEFESFKKPTRPLTRHSTKAWQRDDFYKSLRAMRYGLAAWPEPPKNPTPWESLKYICPQEGPMAKKLPQKNLQQLTEQFLTQHTSEWVGGLELLELARSHGHKAEAEKILLHLKSLRRFRQCIDWGIHTLETNATQ